MIFRELLELVSIETFRLRLGAAAPWYICKNVMMWLPEVMDIFVKYSLNLSRIKYGYSHFGTSMIICRGPLKINGNENYVAEGRQDLLWIPRSH